MAEFPTPIRPGNWYIIDGVLTDVPEVAPVAEPSVTDSEAVEAVASPEAETQTEVEQQSENSPSLLSRWLTK
jgi:hypothetical protein